MGAFLAPLIGAGASIIGGLIGSRGASDAADRANEGSEREIAFARESRDLARGDQAPYREAGATALDALMSMTGLKGTGGAGTAIQQRGNGPVGNSQGGAGGRGQNVLSERSSAYRLRYAGGPLTQGGALYNVNEMGPESVYQNGSYTRSGSPQTLPPDPTGYVAPNIQGRAIGGSLYGSQEIYGPGGSDPGNNIATGGYQPPQENPGGVEGGYNFMTDPGYEFRRGEGQRAVERGAAARGGLLSGGTGRALTRYGQDYASNEYTNVYNRISNIAGLGQVASGQSGQYAMQYGQQAGGAAAAGGVNSAYGALGQSNAWANAANQVGQLPWDEVFK